MMLSEIDSLARRAWISCSKRRNNSNPLPAEIAKWRNQELVMIEAMLYSELLK